MKKPAVKPSKSSPKGRADAEAEIEREFSASTPAASEVAVFERTISPEACERFMALRGADGIRSDADDVAAVDAAKLRAAGRKVKFAVKVKKGQAVDIKAVDAGPAVGRSKARRRTRCPYGGPGERALAMVWNEGYDAAKADAKGGAR